MKKKINNTRSLKDLKTKYYGKKGTNERDRIDREYEDFKIGVLIKQARIESGLTQQELANKVGTTKSYISKIENNIKEVRISTLKRIVEFGLGGNLELKINLR